MGDWQRVSIRRVALIGCTPKGSYDNAASKKGSEKGGSQILKCALHKVHRMVLRRCLVVGCHWRKMFSEGVLRRGFREGA